MTAELEAPPSAAARGGGLAAAICLTLVVGALLGTIAWWADQLSWFGIPEASPEYVAFGVLQVFGNGPTLWLLGAFVVGFAAGRFGAGVLLSTASLVLAVGVYYALIVVADTRPGAELGPSALAWAAVAIVSGPPMGAAGAAASSRAGRGRVLGAGVLGGALVGIGLWLFSVPVAAVMHVAGGVGLAAWLAGHERRLVGVGLTVVLGAVAFGLLQLAFALVWAAIR